MLYRIGAAVSYYHCCPALQQRAHQLFNILSRILVVRVGIYYDIRSKPKAGIYSRHKALGKTAVVREANDMVHAKLFCPFHGSVGASVVYNKVFYLVYPIDMTRQIVNGDIQRFRLVVTGYLNNQFHFAVIPSFCFLL